MSTQHTKSSILYWVVSVIALLWNAMGVFNYLGQAYQWDSFTNGMNQKKLDLMGTIPAWVTAAFAVAVFSGIIGSILLLLKKKSAIVLFVISLTAVIVQMSFVLFSQKAKSMYNSGDIYMTVAVVSFALFLTWFSRYANNKKWLQ